MLLERMKKRLRMLKWLTITEAKKELENAKKKQTLTLFILYYRRQNDGRFQRKFRCTKKSTNRQGH